MTMCPVGPPAILFVCLGNICRSPLAEAALRHAAARLDMAVETDSAGTAAWHTGKAPDPRSRAEAARHGIDIAAYRARQVCQADFETFDLILAMDSQNLADLRSIAPAQARASLSLLLDHVPGMEGRSVNDPYYGGPEGFEETWKLVSQAACNLLENLKNT